MHLQTLRTPAYSNCKMLSPTGVFMCRMGKKRVDWYVERGLAKVVSDDPYTIQLLFEPNGLGNYKDEYYLAEKDNVCVVCGSNHDLTKHHALPRCFRKHFPDYLKRYDSHDVLLVCRHCHEAYEVHATELKKKLVGCTNITSMHEEDIAHIRAIKAAKTLVRYGNRIPDESALRLMLRIEEYAGDFNDEIVEELASERFGGYHSADVWREAVEGINDYNEFTKMWREHFVKTMNPQYLPEHWDIKREIDCDERRRSRLEGVSHA